jgi:dethiobiotin synthase
VTGRVLVVTGTDTGVGKTTVTAALAATATGSVVMVKPTQTGTDEGEPTDAEVVRALAGCDVEEYVSLAEPLAPETAARRAGVTLPTVAEHAARIAELTARYDLVLVEGAGGVLVRLDTEERTLLDLAAELPDPEFVVVCAAGLGTLNHTELTVAAVEEWAFPVAGLVIGSWPDAPDLAETCNRDDLPRVTGVPLWGAVPAGAGALDPAAFRAAAPRWLSRAGR